MTDEEIQKEYEAFLQDVLNNEKVWLLQNAEGMACQDSIEYEGAMCVLFWSDCTLAEAEREEDFNGLQTESLELFEFMFQWLPNMAEEGVICGLNWFSGDGGLEVEPIDLLEHLKLIIPDDLAASYKAKLS